MLLIVDLLDDLRDSGFVSSVCSHDDRSTEVNERRDDEPEDDCWWWGFPFNMDPLICLLICRILSGDGGLFTAGASSSSATVGLSSSGGVRDAGGVGEASEISGFDCARLSRECNECM